MSTEGTSTCARWTTHYAFPILECNDFIFDNTLLLLLSKISTAAKRTHAHYTMDSRFLLLLDRFRVMMHDDWKIMLQIKLRHGLLITVKKLHISNALTFMLLKPS